MKINITGNLPAFSSNMQAKKRLVNQVVRKGVIDATAYTYKTSRENLQALVYRPSIPTVTPGKRKIKSGKNKGKYRRNRAGKSYPAWRRSKDLRTGERMKFEGRGADYEGIIYNETEYATARHNLNRPSPVDGKVRSAPWRTTTVKQATPRVQAFIGEAIRVGLDTD